jgi:WD40 repeat protein
MKLLSVTTAFAALAVGAFAAAPPPKKEVIDPKAPVSYWKQIRPIFQAQCQGCHQPAKDKGGYVMTEFKRLLGEGDSGKKAIVPGKPEQSFLFEQITPKDGEAEMPKGKPPLLAPEVALIRKWIAQGAKDDTPKNAVQTIDEKHPPVYQRPPVITSLDYSPDGKLLAVAGFHEVLLHKADGSGIVARLVGLSERIESVRFSPDGKSLAVAGGLPARMGEVQIWDVEKRKLTLSLPVGYDTVYGVSWSPDSKLVAFGCPDFTVRAIEAASGKQILQQGSHSDWVLDTVFNTNGSHIISVGRDMSTKLTEVETQRFIDNISSITPGALRGGIHAVALRPGHDEVLLGGADGVPQVYRIFRKAVRRIGDNANLLRKFPPMEGRIFSVDYSADGKLIAAGASLDGRGAVNIYTGTFDSNIPTNIIKTYEAKIASAYSAEDKEAIEKFTTAEVKLVAETKLNAGVYAVSFSPDGKTLAAAGEDGRVRFINTADGKIVKEFVPVPVKGLQLTRAEPQPAAKR